MAIQVRIEWKNGDVDKFETPPAFVSDGFGYVQDRFFEDESSQCWCIERRWIAPATGETKTWGQWPCLSFEHEPYVAYIIIDGEVRFENTEEEVGSGQLVQVEKKR